MLAIFYRAAGDLGAAATAARETKDQRLIDALLVEHRDWATAAADTIRRRPADIEAMGYVVARTRKVKVGTGVVIHSAPTPWNTMYSTLPLSMALSASASIWSAV